MIFRTISIRTKILINFTLLILLTTAGMIISEYYFGQKMAQNATETRFKEVAGKIALHMRDRDTLAKSVLSILERYPGIRQPVTRRFPRQVVQNFTHFLSANQNICAVYVGHPNGNLLRLVNLRLKWKLHQVFQAPQKARWLLSKVYTLGKQRIASYDFMDKNLKILAHREEPSQYRADTRPWFIGAEKTKSPVRSALYLFSTLGQKGITYSKRLGGTSLVLGMDITLSRLKELLSSETYFPSSLTAMFDGQGHFIASSHPIHPATLKIFTRAMARGTIHRIFKFRKNGREVYAMVTPFYKESDAPLFLGFTVDIHTMMQPYMTEVFTSIGVAIVLLILCLPMAFYSASHLAEPIKALMVENEKIRSRRFDEVGPVQTNINELVALSHSLVTLSENICAYQKAQKNLLDSFVKLVADTIDAKSIYTGGHCQRVPALALMLAKAAEEDEQKFKDFRFPDEESRREFEIGAWLHDCGKITTPEFVVDKATKLETIHNRIHEIRTRFEVIWRDVEIEYYKKWLAGEDQTALEAWKKQEHKALLDDFSFVASCNLGSEFMDEEKKARIRSIARRTWVRHFDNRLGLAEIELARYKKEAKNPPVTESLLSDRPEHLWPRVGFDETAYRNLGFKLDIPPYLYNQGEIYNLCIERGTLTHEERFKIQEHVMMTIRMLERLPFPDHMKRIPEYAGTHHETLIGTGYPKKLTAESLSLPARIMAIADIFEALTASDRPYKKAKKLSEALRILSYLRDSRHIDPDLFELFLKSGVYLEYARRYLKPELIDTVDIEPFL